MNIELDLRQTNKDLKEISELADLIESKKELLKKYNVELKIISLR